jgi:predicted metal-dependent peptidase
VPQDTSWSTPNRRFVWQDAYLPGAQRENLPGVRLIIDTSGSVSQRMRELFRDHIQTLVREYRPAYVEVLYADTHVQRVDVFSPDDDLELRDVQGGGTYFQPALDWEAGGEDDPEAGDFRGPPCCAVYLTDTYGGVTDEPDYAVLWAYPEYITSPYALPFGEFVKLSEWA